MLPMHGNKSSRKRIVWLPGGMACKSRSLIKLHTLTLIEALKSTISGQCCDTAEVNAGLGRHC